MKSISKNKLKLLAMKEIVKNNPTITAFEFNKLLNKKLEHYAYVLERIAS